MSLLSSQKIAENRPNPLKMLKQLRILWKKEVDDYTKMNVRFRRPTCGGNGGKTGKLCIPSSVVLGSRFLAGSHGTLTEQVLPLVYALNCQRPCDDNECYFVLQKGIDSRRARRCTEHPVMLYSRAAGNYVPRIIIIMLSGS